MTAKLERLLSQGSVAAAKDLIGWRIYRVEDNGSRTGGAIVETEAYTQEDAASHSFRGPTPRTEIMFGPSGYVYVYFTYGMHWCMNIVTGHEGHGEAVLIRAIQPDSGIDRIRERRGNITDAMLTNGPAKVCQSLYVTGADNGTKLNNGQLLLLPPTAGTSWPATATKRIGITKDTHRLWRFISKNP